MARLQSLLSLALVAGLFAALPGCAKNNMPMAPAVVATSGVEAERSYRIEDMMGVGPVYGEKLREAGVTNTKRLLEETSTRYKRKQLAEETGIPYKRVLAWAQKVALMKISGIGPRQSNLLAAVGIESVTELARRDEENLFERVGVANAFKPHFVDGNPSLATVTRWIKEAKQVAKQVEAED